jgi:hypothetical protein
MIENAIMRGNQMASIEMGITGQIMYVSELILDYIIALSKYFPSIKCYGVYGNHGRITSSPTDSHPSDNFDKLVYWLVQERIKGMSGISMEFTEAQHMIININGWNCWLEHGDTIKGWAGIPFYGGTREKSNLGQMLDIVQSRADYMFVAHHHRNAEFDNIVFNGSFVGGDIYSIGRLRRMAIPVQMLMGISKKHGIVWTRPISLIDNLRDMKAKIY